MVDAVIVAAARSPIGRAVRGSLAGMRPDEPAAQLVDAVMSAVPGPHASDIDDGQTARMAFHAFRAGEGEWHDPRLDGELPDIRCEQAAATGFWHNDITPVTVPDGSTVTADDGPRPGVTYEAVLQLQPVFRPNGRVAPGNCCALNDGAAALVITSDGLARERDLTPLARIESSGVAALSPEIMGLGPIDASRRALARARMTINDIHLVEINERSPPRSCHRNTSSASISTRSMSTGAIALSRSPR